MDVFKINDDDDDELKYWDICVGPTQLNQPVWNLVPRQCGISMLNNTHILLSTYTSCHFNNNSECITIFINASSSSLFSICFTLSYRLDVCPMHEVPPHILEYCSSKQFHVIFHTLSPSLPAPAHTSHPHHHHMSTG